MEQVQGKHPDQIVADVKTQDIAASEFTSDEMNVEDKAVKASSKDNGTATMSGG